MTEEEEFEFRARLEAEQASTPKEKTKGWADSLNPTMRKVLQIGLPTAGAVAGELLAAPLTGGMSGLAALGTLAAAGGVGSLGGEAINQATGISPQDSNEQLMALLAPGGGRAAVGALANIPRMMPGFSTALKAAHLEDIKGLAKKVLPGPDSEHIYSQLAKQQATGTKLTQFPALQGKVTELQGKTQQIPWDELKTKLNEQGLDRLFIQISDSLTGRGGTQAGLTFDEVRAASEGMNRIISGTSDKVIRGNYIQLQKAMLEDLEKMPPIPGVPTKLWEQARHANKLERARVALQDATEKSVVTKDGIDIPNPDRIVSWLRKEGKKEIMDRVGPTQYRDILNTYRLVSSNMGHDMPRFFSMVLGGTIGAMSGGTGWAVAGASSGFLAAEHLSKMMMTERGRKVVKWMASDPRTSTMRRVGAAAGAAGAALDYAEGEE